MMSEVIKKYMLLGVCLVVFAMVFLPLISSGQALQQAFIGMKDARFRIETLQDRLVHLNAELSRYEELRKLYIGGFKARSVNTDVTHSGLQAFISDCFVRQSAQVEAINRLRRSNQPAPSFADTLSLDIRVRATEPELMACLHQVTKSQYLLEVNSLNIQSRSGSKLQTRMVISALVLSGDGL